MSPFSTSVHNFTAIVIAHSAIANHQSQTSPLVSSCKPGMQPFLLESVGIDSQGKTAAKLDRASEHLLYEPDTGGHTKKGNGVPFLKNMDFGFWSMETLSRC